MKLSKPRIQPLTEAEWTEEQRPVLEPVYKEGRVYNVLGTLARHWPASDSPSPLSASYRSCSISRLSSGSA